MDNDTRLIPISEIYGPVIQGEGQVAGVPTVFVRTGGCDFRCSWCDSLYAVLPEHKGSWMPLTAVDIIQEVRRLAGPECLITLSGGNPALHRLDRFVYEAQESGYYVGIETQGTKLPDWAYMLDSVTISPKPPSSGMAIDWAALDRWAHPWLHKPLMGKAVKVVVFDDADYEFVRAVRDRYQEYVPIYLQAGTSEPYQDTSTPELMAGFREAILSRLEWLQNKVIADRWYNVRVLPQIHALINGAKRGV